MTYRDTWDFEEILHIWCNVDGCGWVEDAEVGADPADIYDEHRKAVHDDPSDG